MRFLISFYESTCGELVESILDILFPSLCINCGKNVDSGEALCAACFAEIPFNKSFFCGKCGARLPYGEKICHFDFPYILGAAVSYKNAAVRELVRELKFGFVRSAARPLADLLIAYSENAGLAGKDWLVIPIPLGKKRLRIRGFNQAELIANIFAEHFSINTEKGILLRKKETEPQSEIKKMDERAKNTKDCFAVAAPEKISGRNIIIVDDVSTSGSTFFEAAVSLKKAGAHKILALAAAKG
ncbi:MAG TPA: ComF family protein [Candidatus Paceibacterota bacterium]|nr:ComF family protein [Candidatus Paceibacterota bacterium]